MLPPEGSVISVERGEACLAFKVHVNVKKPQSSVCAVVYPNLAWEAFKVKDKLPWEILTDIPKDLPSAGIIAPCSGQQMPEGFSYDRAIDGVWEWFTRYEMAPKGEQYKPSRLAALKAGQYIQCTGKILGGNSDGAVLVAFAQAHEKEGGQGELRRFAVLAFADELRLAELMGKEQGWIEPSEPSSEVSTEELHALLAKVPDFLGRQPKVTTLQSKFSRLPMPVQQLLPRSRRTAAAGAGADEASALSPAATESDLLPPSLRFDLKGVQVGKLRALSEGQLSALCNERELPLASDAGAPQMLQALLQFRSRVGRTRRASGSSSGQGGKAFDDDDDGGAGSDARDDTAQGEQERKQEREQARKQKREQERAQEREQEREQARKQKREQERAQERKRAKKEKKKKQERARTPSPVPSSSSTQQ
jgi:hypothetical protein